MSVENQNRRLARPLELQGGSKEEEEVLRRSKTIYTREFLLSCAELDDCKQFLTGFDPSVLRPSKTAYTREFLLSCAELDVCKQLPAGFDPSVFRSSRTAYTRDFLLSCTELDVCKQLPEGFDSSVLFELEDDFKGLLEPGKGSGILFLPNSGSIRCRAQFLGLDSSGSFWQSAGRSDHLSLKWSRESNSRGNYHSDFRRHDDITRCLVEVPGWKAEDTAKRFQETEKNDYCQLSKSENPYRPPHTYQGGRTKYGRKSHSKEIVIEKMDSGIQEETRLEKHRIAKGEQHEIKDATSLAEDISNCPVYYVKPLSHAFNYLEHNVTSDSQIIEFDSKKVSMSTIGEDLNEEQSRMTLKEDVASSLKVPICYPSTVFENALPQSLAVNSECGKGFSGTTCFPITEDLCSTLKNSSESNRVDFQSRESISGMEFKELLGNKAFYSAQRGSFNKITRDEVSELYRFPFTIVYDLVSSVLCEHNPIRANHQRIIAANAAEEIDLHDREENECTFDDLWSEIIEILKCEQEMELASAAESDQTADFKVQICLPDDHSLISIHNPASSGHSGFVPLNSSDDIITHYDAKIHLPDENSLITIDDLIAPEDRLISFDHPTRPKLTKLVPLNSSFEAADYIDAEIRLPDEDSLITIDDLIAPNTLKFLASGQPELDDTWMSHVRDEVAGSGALVITDPAKTSATQGLEVPPSLDVTAWKAHQELHFCQSSLHNSCSGINPETAGCCSFKSLVAQTSLQTTFMDPVPVHCRPALHWYSCPNVVRQFPGKAASPKLKEFNYPLVQYSLLQKPTNFLQQNYLPIKDVTFSNLEAEKKQLFPQRHQQTAYPDLVIANSAMLLDPLGGFDHQMADSTKPKHAL